MPRACTVVLHVLSYKESGHRLADATGLSRGTSRSLTFLAANVKHHGASPWHRDNFVMLTFSSSERETPRGEPVASRQLCDAGLLAANVKHHGASPWHRDNFLMANLF